MVSAIIGNNRSCKKLLSTDQRCGGTDNEANRDVWTNVARIRDLVAADSSTLWFYTAGVGAAFETYRSSEDPKPKLIKIDNLVEKVQDVLGIQYVQEFGMGKGTLDRVQLGCELLNRAAAAQQNLPTIASRVACRQVALRKFQAGR